MGRMNILRGRLAPLLLGIFAAACAWPGVSSAAETVRLSVSEAVRTAIERNLGLKVASFEPAIAETEVRKARSIYDPSLSALLNHSGSNLPRTPGSDLVDRSRQVDLDASLSRLLPTGATAALSFNNRLFRDNGPATSRYARPELSFSVSQPLLKGLGRDVTERGIRTAEDAMDAQFAEWSRQALETAATARNRYLELVKARENLSTRRASLALAQRLHEENEARVRAGVLASYQLQDSLLGVLRRQSELLESERLERDAADRLLTALNLPPGTTVEDEGIPLIADATESETEALRTAMSRRPDLIQARIAVRTAEFNERVARNLALPSLALEGSAGIAGLDDSYGSALDDLGDGDYPAWSVGLSFSVPIGNRSARADLAASRLKAGRERTRLASIEESAGYEVRAALRALDTRRKQIDVTAQGVATAETVVASYKKRQQLGLATTRDLLDAETSLTQARESQSAARADYHSAFTELWKATGELLDREGLKLEGTP